MAVLNEKNPTIFDILTKEQNVADNIAKESLYLSIEKIRCPDINLIESLQYQASRQIKSDKFFDFLNEVFNNSEKNYNLFDILTKKTNFENLENESLFRSIEKIQLPVINLVESLQHQSTRQIRSNKLFDILNPDVSSNNEEKVIFNSKETNEPKNDIAELNPEILKTCENKSVFELADTYMSLFEEKGMEKIFDKLFMWNFKCIQTGGESSPYFAIFKTLIDQITPFIKYIDENDYFNDFNSISFVNDSDIILGLSNNNTKNEKEDLLKNIELIEESLFNDQESYANTIMRYYALSLLSLHMGHMDGYFEVLKSFNNTWTNYFQYYMNISETEFKKPNEIEAKTIDVYPNQESGIFSNTFDVGSLEEIISF